MDDEVDLREPHAAMSASSVPERDRRSSGQDPLDRLDPAAVPPATWRQEIVSASSLIVLAGVWLAASPAALPYSPGDPAASDVICGAFIALLGVLRLSRGLRAPWLGWATAAAGGYVLLSGIALADSGAARWNEMAIGALVVILGFLGSAAASAARRASAGA